MRREDFREPLTKNHSFNHNYTTAQKENKLGKIYLVSTILNIIINLDHGIIPACTFSLKEELGIDDLFLGFLGSMVFAGLMFGSLISGYLFTKYSCKKLIVGSLIFVIVGIFGFTFSGSNRTLMIFSRLVTGFFQVFLVVYFPVWVDFFAEKKKTMWLTYLQIGVPFGVFLGYGITGIFNTLHEYYPIVNWRWSFYLQSALIVPCLIYLATTDKNFLATNGLVTIEEMEAALPEIQAMEREKLPVVDHLVYSPKSSIYMMGTQFNMEDILKRKEEEFLWGQSMISETDSDNSYYQKITKVDKIIKVDHNGEDLEHLEYLKAVRVIFKKHIFICAMLAISSIYFVVTGIQFWISDYMIVALGARKQKVFTMFALVSITAPTLGVVLGGRISESLGGYTGKNALDFCLVTAFLAIPFAISIPFVDNFYAVGVLLWFVFFLGGGLLPTLTGLMLSSIPKQMRSIGSSIAQFIQNLTGYLPAPVLYGYVIKCSGNNKSRWGMMMLMAWSFWAFLALFIAKVVRSHKKKKKMKKLKNKIDLELEDLTVRESGAERSRRIPFENLEIEIPTYEEQEDISRVEMSSVSDLNPYREQSKLKNIGLVFNPGMRKDQFNPK